MNEHEPIIHRIGTWDIMCSELISDDGRLYERTFKCWRFDHLGSHSEYFDSLVEAVDFAQEQAGEPREPWPVVAKMAAAAANYHRKLNNERI